jgi:hypothetical protein
VRGGGAGDCARRRQAGLSARLHEKEAPAWPLASADAGYDAGKVTAIFGIIEGHDSRSNGHMRCYQREVSESQSCAVCRRKYRVRTLEAVLDELFLQAFRPFHDFFRRFPDMNVVD